VPLNNEQSNIDHDELYHAVMNSDCYPRFYFQSWDSGVGGIWLNHLVHVACGDCMRAHRQLCWLYNECQQIYSDSLQYTFALTYQQFTTIVQSLNPGLGAFSILGIWDRKGGVLDSDLQIAIASCEVLMQSVKAFHCFQLALIWVIVVMVYLCAYKQWLYNSNSNFIMLLINSTHFIYW